MTKKNPHAVALGRKGGHANKGKTSPAKAAAARRNGQLGGRPMKKLILTGALLAILGSVSLVAYSETCFSKGEKTDGMNKTCFYSCPSGEAAITISSVKLCPLSIQR
jgi:hypothetical protein